MSENTAQKHESTEPRADRLTGPRVGTDRVGTPDHEYYRCERCSMEAIDRAFLTDDCTVRSTETAHPIDADSRDNYLGCGLLVRNR